VNTLKCLHCDYFWFPRSNSRPGVCPSCHSPNWDKPRKWERPDLRRDEKRSTKPEPKKVEVQS